MTMSMNEIERALRELRLSGVRATLDTRVLQAQATQQPFLETFSLILQDELDRRRSRLTERRYQHSGLDERVTLHDFDWRFNPKLPRQACFELHTLKFITEGSNALIIGKTGTGKSHVAKAVAYHATLQGYHVRYVEADSAFAQFALASSDEQAKHLKDLLEPDLLVLDDMFLARRINDAGAELLQTVVHQRYKLRRSIVVTSNRVVQDWGKYLGDNTMSTTILDRLMHRSALLEFEGKSYRLKEAAARMVQPDRARPPWTSHLPTGRACGQPLRGSWPAHRSPAVAFGLTRFACPTPIDQRSPTRRESPVRRDPAQTPQNTDTSTVLPGGVWGGHRWRNLKWPSGSIDLDRSRKVSFRGTARKPAPMMVSYRFTVKMTVKI